MKFFADTSTITNYRELMMQVWYPADVAGSPPNASYIEDGSSVIAEFSRVHHKPSFLFQQLKDVKTNALLGTPMAQAGVKFPVLIFLEGLTGFRQMNTFQVEELVSNGYVVVAIDQPYTAAAVIFPDGQKRLMLPLAQILPLVRSSYIPEIKTKTLHGKLLNDGSIVPYLAQDVTFTLDELVKLDKADPKNIVTGRLDLNHVGVFGVSLGGIVAAEASLKDTRLKACLLLDAPMSTEVVKKGLTQPAMWITRSAETMRLERQRAGGWSEAEINAHLTSMRAVFKSLPRNGYFVQVPGVFHSNFTDIPSWSPLFSLVGIAGPANRNRAHEIINAYSLAFFDHHIKDKRAELLIEGNRQYPDVHLETK